MIDEGWMSPAYQAPVDGQEVECLLLGLDTTIAIREFRRGLWFARGRLCFDSPFAWRPATKQEPEETAKET